MNFFNIDLHISVIKDIKTIFENLGHNVENYSLSSHNWIMNFSELKSKALNKDNWYNINDEMCESFYKEYKNKLDKYDAFIVTHTPIFAKLYEKFNKPIIVIASTRYEFPYTFDKNKWNSLNIYLKTNKNVLLFSNNMFDKKYCELFLDKEVSLIESLCEYTNTKYTGEIDDYIIFSKKNIDKYIFNKNIIKKESLGVYSWQDLCERKAIIHLPYNISTMSFFEQYYANVPLFVPTKNLLMNLYDSDVSTLSEISYMRVHNFGSTSLFNIEEDPNKWNEKENINKWINYADFYTLENVQYFDNLYDINFLDDFDFSNISKKMTEENNERKLKVYTSWKDVIKNIK